MIDTVGFYYLKKGDCVTLCLPERKEPHPPVELKAEVLDVQDNWIEVSYPGPDRTVKAKFNRIDGKSVQGDSDYGWLKKDPKREKRDTGNFVREDLSSYAQDKVAEGTKVLVLREKIWTRVGDTWVLLKEFSWSMDDANARVVTRKHVPFLFAFIACFAYDSPGDWVYVGDVIPGTDVVIDDFYVGDGSPATVLVAQAKEIRPK